MAVAEYLSQLQKDKQALAKNLSDKGVEVKDNETFTTLVPKVATIETASPIEDYIVITPSTKHQTFLPKEGYDGIGRIEAEPVTNKIDGNIIADNIKEGVEILGVTGKYDGVADLDLQTKVVNSTASEEGVDITCDSGYDALGKVHINPIKASQIPDLRADIIKRGEEVLEMVGTYGPTSQVKNIVPSKYEQTIGPDPGFEYLSKVTVNRVTAGIDSNIMPENIKNGIEVLGITGTFRGDFKFQTKTGYLSAEKAIVIEPDSGYDAMTSVTIPVVTSSIDPEIQPGNIRQGVNILGVTGVYAPAPSMINKTVYPRTYEQTVRPDEGYGTLDKVTVAPVTSSIDSNIKANNIREEVEILGVKGTLEPVKGESIIIEPTINSQYFIPSEEKNAITHVTVNPVTSTIDDKIIPENIKEGVVILGTTGTFNGGLSNLQSKTITPSLSSYNVTADTGYDALSTVVVESVPLATEEESIVLPSITDYNLSAPDGKFFKEVIVEKVTSDIDPNIRPENIKENMSILGVIGTYAGEEQTYFTSIPAGDSYSSGIGKAIINVPENLRFASSNGSYAFYNSNITKVPNIDYTGLTNMTAFFSGCKKITDWTYLRIPETVTNLSSTFSSTVLPSQDLVIDVPNVTNAYACFSGATQSGGSVTLKIGAACTNCNNILTNSNIKTFYLDAREGVIAKPTLVRAFTGIDARTPIVITDRVHPTSLEDAFYAGSGSEVSATTEFTVNITECTTMRNMFNCYSGNSVHTVNFHGDSTKLTDMYKAFYFSFYVSQELVNINGLINAGKVINIDKAFDSATVLVNFQGLKDLGKGFTQKTANYANYVLDLDRCNKLSHDSLVSIINNLYDLNLTYDVANGGTLYTQKLVLGGTNRGKLTAEEIAVATAKGWTVS
jgi:hypothetical protein